MTVNVLKTRLRDTFRAKTHQAVVFGSESNQLFLTLFQGFLFFFVIPDVINLNNSSVVVKQMVIFHSTEVILGGRGKYFLISQPLFSPSLEASLHAKHQRSVTAGSDRVSQSLLNIQASTFCQKQLPAHLVTSNKQFLFQKYFNP